jgi:FlaG/FlaF family flagellin (archaellin)
LSSSSSSSSAGAAKCVSEDGTCAAESASARASASGGSNAATATADVVVATNVGATKQIDLAALYQSLKIEIEREGKFYVNTMSGFIEMGSSFLDGTFTPKVVPCLFTRFLYFAILFI